MDIVLKKLPKPGVKKSNYDYLAPDQSEICLLLTESDAAKASMAYCTLPPGKTALASKHCGVEELWYFTRGLGELWLKMEEEEAIYEVKQGVAITIPPEVIFQFRNLSKTKPLEFVVVTVPHWPGPAEASIVEGKWGCELDDKNLKMHIPS